MTSAERDLVLALRSELAAIEPSRACDRQAEAIALSGVRGPRDAPVARLLLRLAPERDALRAVAPPDARPEPMAGFDWAAAPEHCRLAWLRGLFLAHGSLSLAAGRTHLEFVVERADARILAARLADAGLPAAWRSRRGRGVVTWKHAERVGTFLRRIGVTMTAGYKGKSKQIVLTMAQVGRPPTASAATASTAVSVRGSPAAHRSSVRLQATRSA